MLCTSYEANAEGHGNDADVLDGAIGEHALEVAVCGGVEDAVEAGYDAYDEEGGAEWEERVGRGY